MLEDALDFIASQSTESLIAMYWFVIYIEAPRYLFGGICAAWPIIKYSFIKTETHGMLEDAFMSVIIPAHNDAASVYKTVMSARDQIHVKTQIIVVNDGSSDDTDERCRKMLNDGLIDDYIFIESRGGKSAAVNAALERVNNPFFVITDADTTFDRDAFYIAWRYFNDPKIGAISGNLRIRNTWKSLATRVQQVNYMNSITLGRIVRDALSFYYVASGAFSVFRTSAAQQVGGWEFGPGEDGDISTRLREAGWKVHFTPFAVAMTDGPETFTRLGRQRLRWDRSMIRLRLRKYGPQVLNPFKANFHPMLAISFFDIYFFQGVIPFLFFVYLAVTVDMYGAFSLSILASVQIMYFILFFIKYLIALSVSTHFKEDIWLAPYVPLYSLINVYFLRAVKLYATANELVFRGSYTDQYVPEKVRKKIRRY